MTDQTPIDVQQTAKEPQIPAERLRAIAQAASSGWQVTHLPKGPSGFEQRVQATRDALDMLATELEGVDAKQFADAEPLLEIRENPRLLRAVVLEAYSIRRKVERLPRIVLPNRGEETRAAALAAAYFDAANSIWSPEAFHAFLHAAQESDPLELQELWVVPTMLKFQLLEWILAQANARLHAPGSTGAEPAELLRTRIKTVRDVGYAAWASLIEELVAFEATLQKDPSGTYPRMDFESREQYRKRVAEIARHAEGSESQVATAALEMARQAAGEQFADERMRARRMHIGYYLVDKGAEDLSRRVGYRPRLIDRLRITIQRNADDFYIGSIEILTVLLIAVILLPLIPNYAIFGGLTIAFLLMLLPVTQFASDLVSNIVTSLFKARALPKLDFSDHIPAGYTTLVVVPTLLINEKQTQELVQELEVRFLANPDPNLHFALLTDLPDSITRPRENDTDPVVDLAVQLVNDLNRRYASPKNGTFFLLHRHRLFNARQGVWMGWERKRGKLLDLNKLLVGDFDAFPVKVGNLDVLKDVCYIITLDSDTQLPRGSANSMIGAMAHPLNRAIIDPEKRIVTEGYGILQPRVGVSVHSAAQSRLAAIYSGQTGFDIYTRAISDTYQDLYGEGIFTGKGIYEVATLHAVLDRRFPHNSLLSHDLIEGAYARAGLATDIEVIDDYPSHYSAYTRRKHRWVRGDWQIVQWLLARVPDESGRYVRNPISMISRWKIFDNLRRSLVEPLTMILLVAGWLGLPGGALYWTMATLVLMFLPTFVQLVFSTGRALASEQQGAMREAFAGFLQSAFITFLNLTFLPHQTMLAIDAITRSLVRRFITGQRLLEWETAAEAEDSTRRITPVDRYLAIIPLSAIILAVIILALDPKSLAVAAPVLLLWGFSGSITLWLNHAPREQRQHLSADEDAFLRQHAARIWRYFYQFGGESHNYLIPDNVEEDGLFEAARVSPTNLGLLLNARQAACEFGFLTVPEFTELTHASFATIARMDKLRGHLFNWYNTQTLEPMRPGSVSSVDSGNLAASLYTLRMGALFLLRDSLLSERHFAGLTTYWQLLKLHIPELAKRGAVALPDKKADFDTWIEWLLEHEDTLLSEIEETEGEGAWWADEVRKRVSALTTIVREFMPWLLPEFKPLRAVPQIGLREETMFPPLDTAAEFASQLDSRLSRAWATGEDDANVFLSEQLRSMLPRAKQQLAGLAKSLRVLSDEVYRFVDEMDFTFLLQKGRMLLSIGYDLEPMKLHPACYDLLASEARIAAFVAVAKGDVPQQVWFKMGRTHTMAFGRNLLISWTGTMFEYLMPAVWMRSYPDTLVSRTLAAAVQVQRAYAREHRIPWGISECGYAARTDDGHYHYQAFGIPQIAMKWDATAGPVVSPYSTFLALSVDSKEALRNLRRMSGHGWVGAFGFYEAIDYMQSTREPQPVREWMAHHQGMSLLAILNLLDEDKTKEWFHANAELQATELLLHEKPVSEAALRAEYKQFAPRRMKVPQLKKAS
ncbi:glycosyl transferase [Alloacidobacterium dinghuense]|uniref:Glycosyl transferase n=1 Tax=Alloacidobacterium dinghuense TaxID=2763107 RepID=A0A7G8BIJ6_9BACT|nr:glucoamylase family protein [Alloacidobacterium dinghuense]QNI32366.1 glycosyl transferase [Alloacidobacterium dinghuense]